jgi:hypothetical protein
MHLNSLTHLLGYHQALHIAAHADQICAIRNLCVDDAGWFSAVFRRTQLPPSPG